MSIRIYSSKLEKFVKLYTSIAKKMQISTTAFLSYLLWPEIGWQRRRKATFFNAQSTQRE
jgi:hypothetical protein